MWVLESKLGSLDLAASVLPTVPSCQTRGVFVLFCGFHITQVGLKLAVLPRLA